MIKTKNPYTGETLEQYDVQSFKAITHHINQAHKTFTSWSQEDISKRAVAVGRLAEILEQGRERYAVLITREMGKPITQSRAEIDKCIWLCDFYRENAEDFLADELIETEAQESFISYDALGVILAVMPWNYPFWQVIRFAVPTLMAGNTALLKHASNVTGCAWHSKNYFQQRPFRNMPLPLWWQTMIRWPRSSPMTI